VTILDTSMSTMYVHRYCQESLISFPIPNKRKANIVSLILFIDIGGLLYGTIFCQIKFLLVSYFLIVDHVLHPDSPSIFAHLYPWKCLASNAGILVSCRRNLLIVSWFRYISASRILFSSSSMNICSLYLSTVALNNFISLLKPR